MTDPARAVAHVRIDSPLPHLDRDFDYDVPAKLRDTVTSGSRVRVRFAGRLTSAVVMRVDGHTDHDGALSPVQSSSLVPSYSDGALALAATIAQRYAGSVWDVLRLMAPPRVAGVEKRVVARAENAGWSSENLAAMKQAKERTAATLALAPGGRIVWEATPEPDVRSSVAVKELVGSVLERVQPGGSGVLVLPDARSVSAVVAECERLGLSRWTSRSGGQVAVLDHDDGPSARFGAYLAAMAGEAPLVVGTRATAMQPVPRLDAIAIWDEMSTTYEELHAPYCHARTVVALRATGQTSALMGGYALSAEAYALVEHGWARLAGADRVRVRQDCAAVDVVTGERREAEGGAGWHWMPGSVWRSVRRSLEAGPVAIVVPRTGYARATACAKCDSWALCRECDSMLSIPAPGADPVCAEQGHVQPQWHCAECHSPKMKHVTQGAGLIAEQLRRMLPHTPLTVSTAAEGVVPDGVVSEGLVLATPAAVPAVPGGYAHAVILNAAVPATLGLGGELKAVRWWLNVAALVRSRREGGVVHAVGDLPPTVATALTTWTPASAAENAYRERAALGLPPHRRFVEVQGQTEDVDSGLQAIAHLDGEVVTRTAASAGVLVSRAHAQTLVDALRNLQRTASREGRDFRVKVDGEISLPRR